MLLRITNLTGAILDVPGLTPSVGIWATVEFTVSESKWALIQDTTLALRDGGDCSLIMRAESAGDMGGRIYEETLSVGHADLTAAATSQAVESSFTFPTGARLHGFRWQVATGFAPVLAPTLGEVQGGIAPFDIEPGQTIIIDVDEAGAPQTATFDAAAGYQQMAASPYALRNGDTFDVTLDGGAPVTVTCLVGDFVDITAATAAELAAVVDAALGGAYATDVAGDCRITSLIRGTDSSVLIDNGVPAAAGAASTTGGVGPTYDLRPGGLAISLDVNGAGPATATWDAARAQVESLPSPFDMTGLTLTVRFENGIVQAVDFTGVVAINAVTAAEIIDRINVLVGGHAITNGGAGLYVRSDVYGTSSRVRIGGTGAATVFGVAVDASGTGDVADASAVTQAEVETVIEADTTAEVDQDAGGFIVRTPNTGPTRTLVVGAGTGNTALGLTAATYLGWGAVVTAVLIPDAAVAGTGDVGDIDAVSAAEFKTVVEADVTGVTVTDDPAGVYIRTDTLGATPAGIEVTGGTGLVGLGFAADGVHNGVNGSNSTCVVDWGVGAGALADVLADGQDAFDGSSTAERWGAGGNAVPTQPVLLGGRKLRATVTSDGNVVDFAAGAMQAWVRYSVISPT